MDSNNEQGLSVKQVEAAMLLGTGKRCRFAANAVGVTPATISNWNAMPAFRTQVDRYRAMHQVNIATSLAGLVPSAIERIRELLKDASPAIRLRAAQIVISTLEKVGGAAVDTEPHSRDDVGVPKDPFCI